MQKIILVFSIFCTVSLPAFGEEIYLKNGKVISGIILSSDTESVNLKTDYGDTRIERKDISKIEYPKSVSTVKQKRLALIANLCPFTTDASATPFLWEAGISFLVAPECNIQITGGHLYFGNNDRTSICAIYGYPLRVNVESTAYLNAGFAYSLDRYSYSTYQEPKFPGDNGILTNYLAEYEQYSALFGFATETFFNSDGHFAYEAKVGITCTWSSEINIPGRSINGLSFYADLGLSYYLF